MPNDRSHLITFLGTGNYERVCYQWHDGKRVETSLFPTALPQFLPEIHSATVLVTEQSEAIHGRKIDDQWPAAWRPEHVTIPKGSSTDELWTIFDKVVDAVPRDCRVVFDITHAFRSIPLISVLAVAYLWSARDIQLQALVYGALDAKSGDPPVVPVFDLTPMVNLLEWLAAVERFRHHLDGEPLRRLLDQTQRRAHQGNLPQAPTRLQSTGSAVKRLTDALLLGRVREVLREAPKLREALANPQLHAEAKRWAKPFLLMLEPLQATLAEVTRGPEADLDAHYSLASFYADRRLYTLAITLLREWIISKACRSSGIEAPALFDQRRREEIERVLGQCSAARRESKPLPTEPQWLAAFSGDPAFKLWMSVPDIRNDVDHAGMREADQPADRLIHRIRRLFQPDDTP